MAVKQLIEDARRQVQRRLDRELTVVDAVYDDELWEILDSYGLLEKLDAGELRCSLTGARLTRENVGGLIGSPDGPQLICDSVEVDEELASTA